MPTVYHTSLMANDAETNKYFSTPIGTLATPAVLTRATFDGTSALQIALGDETPDGSFAGADGGASGYSDMVANAGSYTDGDIAFCYDIDPAKHGRYVLASGTWVRTGPARPLYEDDNNHLNVVKNLNLLMQTFFDTGHPVAANDGAGPFVDKVAYPNVTDMTDHIMRLTMRAVDLSFSKTAKLGMHLQGQLSGVPRIGSGNSGDGAFPLVNAMNHTDILGKLGAGNAGIYAHNTVQYIADSGWVEVDIPFSASDAMWTMMLGNTDKDAHEGASYSQALHYIGTSADRLVGADLAKVNAYLCAFDWVTTPGTPGTNTPRPRTEMRGDIYVSKIEFLS